MRPALLVDVDVDLYISALQTLDWMFAQGLIVVGTVVYYDDVSVIKAAQGGELRAHEEMTAKYRVEWQDDAATTHCRLCGEKWGMWRRRHHCRACGQLVCDDCSRGRIKARTMRTISHLARAPSAPISPWRHSRPSRWLLPRLSRQRWSARSTPSARAMSVPRRTPSRRRVRPEERGARRSSGALRRPFRVAKRYARGAPVGSPHSPVRKTSPDRCLGPRR